MEPKFNIDRPKISDEEIKKHQNFEQLVKQFKQQSLNKARHDKSWWKSKKVRYSAVIAGITVICTISYLALFKNETTQNKTHETLITQDTKKENTNTKKNFINEPSRKLKVNYTAYTINNAKGGEIKHPTSSKIKVPKNTFVDKEGKDVIGDVTIEYREFHDAADIIASGIPMGYDSAGTKYTLESAGMFDIKGSQNGKPVFIKKDKSVEVELASANSEDRFNQYYLDTVKKNWQYIQKDNANAISGNRHENKEFDNNQKDSPDNFIKKSPKLQILKNQIEVVIPKRIDSVKFVYTKKIDAVPKVKEPNKPAKASGRPTFKLDGSYSEFPELAAFNDVIFEVGPENNNYRKEMHEITWSDVKVSEGPTKGKNYLLTLTYRKQVEKLIVYPVLSGNDLEKAEKKYQQKFKDYKGLVEKRNAEEKRLMAEMEAKQKIYLADLKKKQEDYEKEKIKLLVAFKQNEQNQLATNFNTMSMQTKATRIFNVSSFGIYNSDCPRNQPSGKTVTPMFVVNEKGTLINPDLIYMIDHKTKTVYNIAFNDGFKINYDPQNDYSICVFKQNKLYICTKDMFKTTANKDGNKFTVNELPEGSDNLTDFKKALEI